MTLSESCANKFFCVLVSPFSRVKKSNFFFPRALGVPRGKSVLVLVVKVSTFVDREFVSLSWSFVFWTRGLTRFLISSSTEAFELAVEVVAPSVVSPLVMFVKRTLLQ